ncbi:MAG: metallophosphoesterase family protein [Acetobacteraceae bacterium]|nr:metallophosphoesterase family protein [Acetobacteraceae bacterium]
MTVLFTADTHFGHAGALALYRRPFKSVAEMDAVMTERWNEAVRPQDEVWHLGDFAVRQRPARVAELLASLNGIKHLVAGNNDDSAIRNDSTWCSVQVYCEIVVDGNHFVLCHYAFRTWRNMGQGWINLHGHSHGRLAPQPRQCDVGVDAWDFTPISTVELLERVRGKRARRSTVTR